MLAGGGATRCGGGLAADNSTDELFLADGGLNNLGGLRGEVHYESDP